MKRVMMMRPKLVLKESMSVNQYIPPCDGKTQNKKYMYMTTKTVIVLKESLMDNMKMDKLMNCDLNITDTLLNSGHLYTCIYKNVIY